MNTTNDHVQFTVGQVGNLRPIGNRPERREASFSPVTYRAATVKER